MDNKDIMFAEQRQLEIVNIVKTEQKVTVAMLCEIFSVSGSTIRNDLRELEQNGRLKRTHGGAIAVSKTQFELDTEHKETLQKDLKQNIAAVAKKLIEDGDTIFLDNGTTCYELAKLLDGIKNLTVVTNDLRIALELEKINLAGLHLIGGEIRRGYHATIGPSALRMAQGFHVDKSFIAANGVTVLGGITTPNVNMAEIKKTMVAAAGTVILVCDNTKFGHNAFSQICSIVDIDTIVTDSEISERMRADFEIRGIEVLTS